jgi:peptidylprolyl isomerase
MRVGGRRELVEPSRLAYGTGDLIYVVDLLAVNRRTPRQADSSSAKVIAERPTPEVRVPKGAPPRRLVVEDLIGGIGAGAKEGDKLAVRYLGLDYKTGKEFENSWTLTYRFELGAGEVNEGWEEGLGGMKVGGRRELIVPPRLAPPGRQDTLVYVIDLVAIK